MIKDISSRRMMINDNICPGGNDEIGKMEPSERHLLIPQVIMMNDYHDDGDDNDDEVDDDDYDNDDDDDFKQEEGLTAHEIKLQLRDSLCSSI